jgi:hypothetical protein
VSGDVRLVRALVACYPAGWRRRYGDEYAQLLCDLRIHRRPALIVDSLRGAVRAYGGVLMTRYSPMTIAVWAAGLFTVAGIGFAKLAEDFTGLGSGMYALLVAAAAVALLALVAAAAPTAVALLRGRDAGAWKYVAVPFVGAVVWFGVLRLALAFSAGHGVHSAPNVTGFVLIAVSGIGLVAATAWAAATVLRRMPVAQPVRLRPVAVMTLAGGMAVASVAALIWGLRVRSGDPAGFRGDHGILATPFVPSWIAVVVALAAATVLAALAGRRQLAAVRQE